MSRTLTFNVGQLTKDVQVVFVVQAPTNAKIGDDGYYIAWRIAELKAGGNSDDRFTVEYPASLGIATAGIFDHTALPSEVWTKIKPGQSTTLALDGEVCFWSEPTEIGGNTIQAINRTGGFQGIALGTVDAQIDSFLRPTFLWNVGAEMTAETDFSPNLMMFVNLDCEMQGSVIFGNLPESMCIWKVNLNAQDPVTHWNFEETPKGTYRVTTM
ncbi:hypothetical protein L218DRAFT_1005942 [Marasmius fiardii PR-910]|nr:hypothetical protein L218DRAFT_1005942 [Marasmius fiardii PR-910]